MKKMRKSVTEMQLVHHSLFASPVCASDEGEEGIADSADKCLCLRTAAAAASEKREEACVKQCIHGCHVLRKPCLGFRV
jgi:hypothetical protein